MSERSKWMIDETLKHEGGYVFNEDDPGGETNFGISKKSYPDVDIKKLTKTKARKIYEEDYWYEFLDELPDPVLALQVFDFGVNAGTGRSRRLLQRVVGVKQDGVIGPVTMAAIEKRDILDTRRKFLERALLYYTELAIGQRALRQFLLSWIRRAVLNYSSGMVLGVEDETEV